MSVQGTMFNPYLSSYSSYAALGDLAGLEDYGTYAYSNPYAGGIGYGNYDYQQYYDNMMKMQEFSSRYSLHSVELQRQNDIAINNADAGLKKAFDGLHTKIVSNEQEQILIALEQFKNAVRAKYPTATEDQISNYAAQIYTQLSGGTSMVEDIKANGSSSFSQGFKQALGLWLIADNKTAEENVADITGLPVSRSDQMAKNAGTVAGATTAGAAIGAGIGTIVPGIGTAIGAGVGAGVGAIVGIIKSIF